jgi:RNA polymerase-binding transcription factor DksA
MAKKPAKKPAKPAAKPKGPVKAGKAAKPAAKKPAAKPAKAGKPAAKPKTMAKPAKPVAKKPAAKPVKPAAKKPVAKPAPKPQPKPAAKAPARTQPAKPAATKPVAAPAKPAPKKPAAPAPKPAPAAAKPETKAAPVAPPKPVKKEAKKEKEAAPKAPAQPLVTQVSAPVRPMAAPVVKKQVSTLESADKARYSDDELAEFKELILKKLEEARKDYDLLKQTLANTDNNGTDDTSPSFKMIEDGSETLSREETAQLAARQEKFIKHLEDALLRIRNKTYGICRVTGRLISKERLRLVPHATLSIEAKQQMGS